MSQAEPLFDVIDERSVDMSWSVCKIRLEIPNAWPVICPGGLPSDPQHRPQS
jgi:hypothetical protein